MLGEIVNCDCDYSRLNLAEFQRGMLKVLILLDLFHDFHHVLCCWTYSIVSTFFFLELKLCLLSVFSQYFKQHRPPRIRRCKTLRRHGRYHGSARLHFFTAAAAPAAYVSCSRSCKELQPSGPNFKAKNILWHPFYSMSTTQSCVLCSFNTWFFYTIGLRSNSFHPSSTSSLQPSSTSRQSQITRSQIHRSQEIIVFQCTWQ